MLTAQFINVIKQDTLLVTLEFTWRASQETRLQGEEGETISFQYVLHLLHILYLSINYHRIPLGAQRIDYIASGNLQRSICHKILVYFIAVGKK